MQWGVCFLWYWLPALLLEHWQVSSVVEHRPLETQLSDGPDSPALGAVFEFWRLRGRLALMSLYSEGCPISPAAHVNPWVGGGSGVWHLGEPGVERVGVEAGGSGEKGFGFGMGQSVVSEFGITLLFGMWGAGWAGIQVHLVVLS